MADKSTSNAYRHTGQTQLKEECETAPTQAGDKAVRGDAGRLVRLTKNLTFEGETALTIA
jgi:hypothetical protein